MRTQGSRIITGVVVCVCLAVVLYFLASKNKSAFKAEGSHQLVMGTFANIIAVAKDSNAAIECIKVAFAKIEDVDKLMSDYKNDSEISVLNRDGFKQAVKVSKPTYEVLQRSIEFSRLSDGAFDVTVGPLVDLWHRAGQANSVPSDKELVDARSKVGYENLIFDSNAMSVRFAVGGMRVDLGAIAKGYAVDKAVEVMKKSGAAGGMVDIGGNIRCFGIPPAGRKYWQIGLQNPKDTNEDITTGNILLVLNLTDGAVATSGDYRRYNLIKGRKYNHIIDRRTGAGAKGLSSVTIISDNATDTDALSTAISVMGADKGLALIKTMQDTEAILITAGPEFKILKTKGANKYID